MLSELLTTCGLNTSEQSVLLFLLRRGSSIASIISKKTQLKRPTVYAVLESLFDRGLITRQKRQGVTYFAPESASLIPKILEQRAEQHYAQIQSASKLLGASLPSISPKEEAQMGGFVLTTLESPETVYALLEDSLSGGDFSAIFDPQKTFVNSGLKKIISKFLQKSAITKPHIREIAISGETTDWYLSKIQNPHHLVKQIPPEKNICSDIILLKDSVIFCHYLPLQEIGIRIMHGELHASMKTVFEMLWESLPE